MLNKKSLDSKVHNILNTLRSKGKFTTQYKMYFYRRVKHICLSFFTTESKVKYFMEVVIFRDGLQNAKVVVKGEHSNNSLPCGVRKLTSVHQPDKNPCLPEFLTAWLWL